MSDNGVKIFVNFKKNRITIIEWERIPIFDENGRYLIEYDHTGFSCIEKREDGFYECNYEFGRLQPTKIFEKKLTEEEAKEIIRETIRREDPLLGKE
jgi:hypothetical protein